MTARSDLAPLEPLWLWIARARRRQLVLDYDGTLAEFRRERHLARPLPGVVDTLRAIAALPHTRVAIVSGRPVRELAGLLFEGPADPSIALFGEHGWERLVGQRVHEFAVSDVPRQALSECAELAVARGWAALLECKRTSLVLHTRGLHPERAGAVAASCRAAWAELADGRGLRTSAIDGGVETRCDARDKGTAVRELLHEEGSDALAIYVGDDETDEDGFRAVRDQGVGVRVARDARPTAAAHSLPDCEAVARWLARWPEQLTDLRPPTDRSVQ